MINVSKRARGVLDMRRNRSLRRQTQCDHERTVSTVSAGIVRLACEECGHVNVRHHHDLVVVGKNELQTAGSQPAG